MTTANLEKPRGLWLAIGLVALIAGALAIRLPRLGARPMHCDEGNQAVRAGLLLETGQYRYDPAEHHGPSLYWLTLPSLWAHGVRDLAQAQEIDFRIVPLVFGVAVIALLALMVDGLGSPAILLAGLLLTVSPAMVFYSRYYIQEMLLVFFTLGAIACGWRYFRAATAEQVPAQRSLQLRRAAFSGRYFWAISAGLCLGLMHATKETWILAAAAAAAALVLTWFWTRWIEGPVGSLRPFLAPGPLFAGLAAAVLIAVALYSSLGTNPRGPLDSILAYGTYFRRGSEGGIHAHPWYYYLQLLLAYRPARGFFWTEGLIVGLALVGSAAALMPRVVPPAHRPLARFLAFYTLALTALYSAVAYKTPWCLLSFLSGMILLAGLGAWTILRLTPTRPGKAAIGLLLLAGLLHLGRETYWLNFRLAADARNPYVYAHTSPDLLNLAARLEQLARVAPLGHKMRIDVVTDDNYWPLPWYLRQFDRDQVGYWPDPPAWARISASLSVPDVLIFTPDVQPIVESHLRDAYNKQMLYGLRPGVLLAVYVRQELWEQLLPVGRRLPSATWNRRTLDYITYGRIALEGSL